MDWLAGKVAYFYQGQLSSWLGDFECHHHSQQGCFCGVATLETRNLVMCFKTALSVVFGRRETRQQFPNWVRFMGFVYRGFHPGLFERGWKGAWLIMWVIAGVMVRAIICRRVVGTGSSGHIARRRFDTSLSVSGVNVEKEGEDAWEHVVGWLKVERVGFSDNWQLITTTFSVKSECQLWAGEGGLSRVSKVGLAHTVSVVLLISSITTSDSKKAYSTSLPLKKMKEVRLTYLLLVVSLSPTCFLVLPSSILPLSGLVRLDRAQISGQQLEREAQHDRCSQNNVRLAFILCYTWNANWISNGSLSNPAVVVAEGE